MTTEKKRTSSLFSENNLTHPARESSDDLPDETTVYFVRHAVPDSHLTNGHLTSQGYAQAKKIAGLLSQELHNKAGDKKPLLVVSPTVRTRETADPIASKLGVRPLIHSAFSEEYLADTNSIFFSPAFLRRHVASQKILRAFRQIVRANHGKTIVIVTHGNVIRTLTGKLLRKSYDEMSKTPVVCGSVTTLRIRGHAISVDKYTEV